MDQELILEYSEKQELRGELRDFQGSSRVQEPGCGDEMCMYLKTHREVITEIRFTITDSACPPVKACGALAAEMALGRPVMEAYLIDADRLSQRLGGLPKENMHCAMMAGIALKKAIKDYVSKRS